MLVVQYYSITFFPYGTNELIGHECETYNNPADFFLDVIYQYEESCEQPGDGKRKGLSLPIPSKNQEGDIEAVEGIKWTAIAPCMGWRGRRGIAVEGKACTEKVGGERGVEEGWGERCPKTGVWKADREKVVLMRKWKGVRTK